MDVRLKMDDDTMDEIKSSQLNEITEYHIYRKLAKMTKDPADRRRTE